MNREPYPIEASTVDRPLREHLKEFLKITDYNSERLQRLERRLYQIVFSALVSIYAKAGRDDYQGLLAACKRRDIPAAMALWPRIDRFSGWNGEIRGYSMEESDKAIDAFYALFKVPTRGEQDPLVGVTAFLKAGGFVQRYLPNIPDGTWFNTTVDLMLAVRPRMGNDNGAVMDFACKAIRNWESEKIPTVIRPLIIKQKGKIDLLEVRFHPLIDNHYGPAGFKYGRESVVNVDGLRASIVTTWGGWYGQEEKESNFYLLDKPYYYRLPLTVDNLNELGRYTGLLVIEEALKAAGYKERKLGAHKPKTYRMQDWRGGEISELMIESNL